MNLKYALSTNLDYKSANISTSLDQRDSVSKKRKRMGLTCLLLFPYGVPKFMGVIWVEAARSKMQGGKILSLHLCHLVSEVLHSLKTRTVGKRTKLFYL